MAFLNGICRIYRGASRLRAESPPHIIVSMPALSPTMNQGNIAKWRKKEGDKIDVGDVICEIETDKATLEFESLEEGFLAKILAPEGSKDVLVGQPIAVTVEDANDIGNVPDIASSSVEIKTGQSTSNDIDSNRSKQKTSFSRISPSAKLLMTEFGLDASLLKASGPRGTLLKSDVLEVLKSASGTGYSKRSQEESSPSTHSRPSTSQVAPKVIAKRLLESKQSIPHLYLSSEQHGVQVSVNDIVIKVVAAALREVPEANAFWNDDEGAASLCDSIDISIAVATEKGLMTPIIRNADQKSVSTISQEVKKLAGKAREGKLSPSDYQGGTFSISNLGMFPVDKFCAIINPPQACILAVGRGNKVVEPEVCDDDPAKDRVVAPQPYSPKDGMKDEFQNLSTDTPISSTAQSSINLPQLIQGGKVPPPPNNQTKREPHFFHNRAITEQMGSCLNSSIAKGTIGKSRRAPNCTISFRQKASCATRAKGTLLL
ncbi:hypothetical protein QJS04_geneDACA005173 [Acorus gramineus]|uniref:Dihydrolipoamide acetyltransferase component of pyruvate dehydrogenase complex n=1 Tax=Acorus gramineus TaxID=55184 RepID=A0AAV9AZ87_ACOGR|nr:hypothetical protein QJS04_geneDACA005173 [Acorus gramineus]